MMTSKIDNIRSILKRINDAQSAEADAMCELQDVVMQEDWWRLSADLIGAGLAEEVFRPLFGASGGRRKAGFPMFLIEEMGKAGVHLP